MSALFIVALAILPTQMKGSSMSMVRVSSKNKLDLFIKQQIRKKNSNLLICSKRCEIKSLMFKQVGKHSRKFP